MQEIDTVQTLRARGICVVIPTYNNVGTIQDVLERTKKQCLDVIVVCDGCTDGTTEKVLQVSDITVVSYPTNKGKGYALKQGFRKALEMGFAYAITLDSDGQHFPEDIPLLLESNIQHPGDLLVGQRKDLDKVERSSGSKFANAFSNFWFCVQTGCWLNDTQTGYRLYPLKKLHGLQFLTSRYEAELELMVFAFWHGVSIKSVPVNVFYPPREERVSHFRPNIDFARISLLNTVLCFLAIVYGFPLKIYRALLAALRTVYSLLFFAIFSLFIMTPFAIVYIKLTGGKSEGVHKMLHFIAKFVLKWHGIPGVKFSIDNSCGESFEKPAIIICNHQSHLDLMTLLVLNPKIVVLTNDWVWNNPFYGYVIRHAEYYPVSAGVEYLMPKLKSLVQRGYSIAVYPEGTRSENCSINRFHKGAFMLSQELNVDILPLILYGAGKALPKKGKYLHKWPIYLEIDKRIDIEELQAMGCTLRKQASQMRKYYQKRYSEIANRIEQDV